MNLLDNKYIFDGNFGLERETLRVDENGNLATTPHPFNDNPFLTKDFCENQLELVTPICRSVDELMETLSALDCAACAELKKSNEYLWLNSNPPHFYSESDIPVARFSGDEEYKLTYRKNLEHRYGKRLMLYSGIHFNFSFSEQFLQSVYNGDGKYGEFKTALYFRVQKQLCRYSWLLVLLTAASPVYDLSLDGDGLSGDGFDGYASRRNSKKGYWNRFIPVLDYSSLETYINSIKNYIKTGELYSAAELYLPVRMKPHGTSNPDALLRNGIDHVELRMFDLNPLSPLGVMREDLEFAHCFIIYLLSLPDFEFTKRLQRLAVLNHRASARYNPKRINGYPAMDAALGLLHDILLFFKGTWAEDVIKFQIDKLTTKSRWCVQVRKKLTPDFQTKMLRLSKELE